MNTCLILYGWIIL